VGRKYKTVEEQGLRFVFAYDDDAPDLLHIYVRHLTSVDDALDTFFNGQTHWNEGHKRFETYTDACGLFGSGSSATRPSWSFPVSNNE